MPPDFLVVKKNLQGGHVLGRRNRRKLSEALAYGEAAQEYRLSQLDKSFESALSRAQGSSAEPVDLRFRAVSWHRQPGRMVFEVENPCDCMDFSHLVGEEVEIDHERFQVVQVELQRHTSPWRKGEQIGLVVDRVQASDLVGAR